MINENFQIKLNKELSSRSLENKFIILLASESKYYFDSILETVKFITDKGMGGVYVTSTYPYCYIVKRFEEYSIEIRNLFFIDTISCMAGESSGERRGCVFIENPAALEEVGMWINILMERIDAENKFLIIDLLPTLLIYNDVGTLKKFSQFLINYLRLSGPIGIFASIDMEIEGSLYETLTALCGKTIKVKRNLTKTDTKIQVENLIKPQTNNIKFVHQREYITVIS